LAGRHSERQGKRMVDGQVVIERSVLWRRFIGETADDFADDLVGDFVGDFMVSITDTGQT